MLSGSRSMHLKRSRPNRESRFSKWHVRGSGASIILLKVHYTGEWTSGATALPMKPKGISLGESYFRPTSTTFRA